MKQQGSPKRPPPDPRPPASADWRGGLRDAILNRVVPRLAEPAAAGQGIGEAEIRGFADAALAGSVPRLLDEVERRRAEGADVERLLIDLVAPTARRLGDMWLDDRLSFIDVTAGLGRLQAVVRALGPALEAGARRAPAGRRVLLAPVPGEQHVLGLSIVAAVFRRAGWGVTFEPRMAFADLVALVRAERFTAIGLSVGGDAFLEALPEQVSALRRASENPAVAMLGGGPSFLLDPDLAAAVGVDAAPRDAVEALGAAECLASRAVV